MMDGTAEKRQYRRARPQVPARCTFIDHPVEVANSQPVVIARLLDLSATGMGLAFPGIVSVGARLKVEFDSEAGRHVTWFGQVVRVDADGPDVTQLVVHGLIRIEEPLFLG